VDLEARGIPAAFVATTEFRTGADAQAKALGANPVAIYVPHPIQDRTDAELIEIADKVFDSVLAALVIS
jgi:hypothetical protein